MQGFFSGEGGRGGVCRGGRVVLRWTVDIAAQLRWAVKDHLVSIPFHVVYFDYASCW